MFVLKALLKKLGYRKKNHQLNSNPDNRELIILKTRNQLLEKSISDFVSNWPSYQGPFRVLLFSLVRKRPFYDSTWLILYQQDGVVEKVEMVREDTQSYEDLKRCLDRCTCVTDMMELDRRSKIYYD